MHFKKITNLIINLDIPKINDKKVNKQNPQKGRKEGNRRGNLEV